MGKVAAEGTAQEQQFMQAQSAATLKGWVTSAMSAEDAQDATYAYLESERAQQSIDNEQNQLGLLRARIGLEADRVGLASSRVGLGTARLNQERTAISLQEDKARTKAQQGAGELANATGTRLRTKFNTIQRQVEAGTLDPVEAAQMMDEEWLMIKGEISAVGQGSGGDYINNLVAPLKDFYEVKRGFVTGETDREVMESVSGRALAFQSMNITGNPETARILATSKIVGAGGNLTLGGPLNEIALNQLDKNGREGSRPADLTDSDNDRGTEQYLTLLNGSLESVERDPNQEELREDVRVNLNQVLKGVASYGNLVENPKDMNRVMDFMGGDRYGAYVETNGTGIDSANRQAVNELVMRQFDEVVRPLVAEEWRNASELTYAVPDPTRPETAGQTESTTSSIRPFFSGNGLRFVATNSAEMNPRLRSKINDLNRTVAPVVSRFIRVGAHTEGHRDYQRIYESNYAGMFGDAGTGAE
jgi:hypothetical protein